MRAIHFEATAYLFVGLLAALVIANAARTPTDPISPDIQFARSIR